jgi:hypothetical protein
MPDKPIKKPELSLDDDYDEKNFIEEVGDDSNGLVLIVKDQTVLFRRRAHVETDAPVGPRVRDRRGHLWALAYQGENQYALDLHGRTPREVMEES